MKDRSKARRGPHLVTADEAAELGSQPASAISQKDMDSAIGNGVRRYQLLQAEADRVLFTDPTDMDKLAELSVELHQLRRSLANYGVRMP